MLRLINVEIFECSDTKFNLLTFEKPLKIIDSSLIVSTDVSFKDVFKQVMDDYIYNLHNLYITENFPVRFSMFTKVLDDNGNDSLWGFNKKDFYNIFEIDKNEEITEIEISGFSKELQ